MHTPHRQATLLCADLSAEKIILNAATLIRTMEDSKIAFSLKLLK